METIENIKNNRKEKNIYALCVENITSNGFEVRKYWKNSSGIDESLIGASIKAMPVIFNGGGGALPEFNRETEALQAGLLSPEDVIQKDTEILLLYPDILNELLNAHPLLKPVFIAYMKRLIPTTSSTISMQDNKDTMKRFFSIIDENTKQKTVDDFSTTIIDEHKFEIVLSKEHGSNLSFTPSNVLFDLVKSIKPELLSYNKGRNPKMHAILKATEKEGILIVKMW